MSIAEDIMNGASRVNRLDFTDGTRVDKIVSNSISLDRNLNIGRQLTFTGCKSSKLEMDVITEDDLSGKEISLVQIINDTEIPMFKGIIDSCEVSKYESASHIIAFDYLYSKGSMDVSAWYDNLTFPLTLKAMRDSLCARLGITQKNVSLVNDNMLVDKTMIADNLSGINMLEYFAQLNGSMVYINELGLLDYFRFDKTNFTDITNDVTNKSTFDKYVVKSIDKVQISAESGDIGGIYGEGENTYIVLANPLVFGKSTEELQTIAHNIYDVVSGITFTPTKLNLYFSRPDIPLGSRLLVHTQIGDIYTYLLNTTFSSSQLIKQNCYCEINEIRDTTIIDSNLQMKQIKGKTNVLEREVEQTRQTITDVEQGLQSQITQTAESLDIRISNLESDATGAAQLYQVEEKPTLDNYPANEWYKLYYPPVDDISAEDYHFPGDFTWDYNYDSYREHQNSLAIIGDKVYRFKYVPEKDWFDWIEEENTEASFLLKSNAQMRLDLNQFKVLVEGQFVDVSGAIQQTKTELELGLNQFKVSVENQISDIDQDITNLDGTVKKLDEDTKAELELVVKKNENDQIISMINESADEINITAKNGGIHITGDKFSLDSTNTKIDEEGNVEFKSGNIGGFNITEDSIECTSGQLETYYYEPVVYKTYLGGYSGQKGIVGRFGRELFGIYRNGLPLLSIVDGGIQDSNTDVNWMSVYHKAWFESYVRFNGNVYFNSEARFKASVYNSAGGVVFTSDKNKKNSIEYLELEDTSNFIYSLKPCKFKYNNGTSGRYHHGLIAQDVEEAMGEDDWGLYCEYTDETTGETTKALRYDELIADLIATVQSQNKRIEELEKIVNNQK